ncbi:chitin deacetylase [Pleurotus pulmonarius]|nr:chitin deacetylase [Pleurotus pulmonarius]
MKLQAFSAFFTLAVAVNAHNNLKARHDRVVHKRQTLSSSTSHSGTTHSTTTTVGATPPVSLVPAAATGTGVPPIESISSGMPTQATLPVSGTFTPGATPLVSGAPVLPTAFVFKPGEWPPQDRVAPVDSAEVSEWLKELEGHNIPALAPTVDGSCAGDPAAAADAANRGWWTCGGHTRATDVLACPDKLTWGVSFDDGPSPYSEKLLNFLSEKDINATFFVVGSRVIERPQLLLEEYMRGHEISVHTWSHRPLTSLTTEQVVAELGWTRKAIKTVLGVTPTTMRPPFGDIDDRVRAISLAMGMVPILWTSSPATGPFDTFDWKVAAGLVKGPESFNTFQAILGNASTLDTGFIVLQHDLYEITVDMAVGHTLTAALTHNPALNLQAIGKCMKWPTGNLYLETNTNATFPTKGVDTDGDGVVETHGKTGQSSVGSNNNGAGFVAVPFFTVAGAMAVIATLLS